jgi:hypothetical protein
MDALQSKQAPPAAAEVVSARTPPISPTADQLTAQGRAWAGPRDAPLHTAIDEVVAGAVEFRGTSAGQAVKGGACPETYSGGSIGEGRRSSRAERSC